MVTRFTTAADDARSRVMDRAGSRIFARAKGHMGLRDKYAQANKAHLAHLIGPEELSQLGETPKSLLADPNGRGAWSDLRAKCEVWAAEWLDVVSPEVSDRELADLSRLISMRFGAKVRERAQATVHRPLSNTSPLGGEWVGADVVWEAVSEAGGPVLTEMAGVGFAS
jgi:hypothetical protein